MTALWVFVGGCVGAVLRHVADRAVQSRHSTALPWGTFTVNMIGAALLGFVVGASAHAPHWVELVAGTGVCGALTTFSSFGHGTVRLAEDGAYAAAGLNVFAHLVLGVGAATAGYAVAAGLL